MNSTRLVAVAAIAFLAVAINAQVRGRQFSYTSGDSVKFDYSHATEVGLGARTAVTVNPYLYIVGNLAAEWTVDGWGTGVDTKVESLRFFHNETLTIDLDSFDNPLKISGTTTGAQTVQLEGELSFFNETTGAALWNSGMVDVLTLNEIFSLSGPHFEVDSTGGLLKLDFSRRITINANVGPGVYANGGLIKVIRN